MLGSKEKEQFSSQVLQICDALVVWLSFVIASQFRDFIKGMSVEGFGVSEVAWMLYLLVPFTPLSLELFGFYRNILRKTAGTAFLQITQTMFIMGSAVGAMIIIFRLPPGSRWIILFGMALSMILIFLRYVIVQNILRRRLRGGENLERVVLAGTKKDIEKLLNNMPESVTDFWQVCGEFDLQESTGDDLEALLIEHSIQRVIFATQHTVFKELSEAVEVCEAQGVEVWLSASFISSQVSRPAFDNLGGSPMLVFKSTPELSWSLLAKALMDKLLATIIITVSLPLWFFAYIGIKVASPGPAFFKQDRAGKYGKTFKMWKFRTMVMNAEAQLAEVKAEKGNEMEGPVFKLEDDPRVFKFARLLRKLSIDELPQLINVLLGDMSLVGPRPLPVYEVEEFEKSTYRRRMSVKPGITCTWQAGGRNSITSFDEWIELDLEYIDNWSFWYDIKIIFKTVPAVLFGSGAK